MVTAQQRVALQERNLEPKAGKACTMGSTAATPSPEGTSISEVPGCPPCKHPCKDGPSRIEVSASPPARCQTPERPLENCLPPDMTAHAKRGTRTEAPRSPVSEQSALGAAQSGAWKGGRGWTKSGERAPPPMQVRRHGTRRS